MAMEPLAVNDRMEKTINNESAHAAHWFSSGTKGTDSAHQTSFSLQSRPRFGPQIFNRHRLQDRKRAVLPSFVNMMFT